MKCAYCTIPIEGDQYSYMWFPDKKAYLTIHPYHLSIKSKKGEANAPKTIDNSNGIEIVSERDKRLPQ